MGKIPKPPAHLKPAGIELWNTINADYDLEGADLSVLDTACTQLDRATAARQMIDAEGAVIRDRFKQQKPHPAIEIEQAATRLYLAAMRQLGLGLSPTNENTRMPQPSGKQSRN